MRDVSRFCSRAHTLVVGSLSGAVEMDTVTSAASVKKTKAMPAARRSLHQFRKRRHIGQKSCESPPPMEKITSGIWRVAGRPLLQTKALRAIRFFSCALCLFSSSASPFLWRPSLIFCMSYLVRLSFMSFINDTTNSAVSSQTLWIFFGLANSNKPINLTTRLAIKPTETASQLEQPSALQALVAILSLIVAG